VGSDGGRNTQSPGTQRRYVDLGCIVEESVVDGRYQLGIQRGPYPLIAKRANYVLSLAPSPLRLGEDAENHCLKMKQVVCHRDNDVTALVDMRAVERLLTVVEWESCDLRLIVEDSIPEEHK
jgi:hypothetical protein